MTCLCFALACAHDRANPQADGVHDAIRPRRLSREPDPGPARSRPLHRRPAPGAGRPWQRQTRVITCRVAHLIHQGVKPYRVLAITFTNKAAGEMRKRVEAMLPLKGM